MTAIKEWFNTKADPNLEFDAIIKKPDIFIAEYIFQGNAVYDLASTTFAPVGAAFVDDEFISLGLSNLQVKDDNGLIATVKIDDNDATTVEFVPGDLLLENDGTTTAALTDAATYIIRILTPTDADEPFGKFFGYTEAIELNVNDELAKFKESTPKVLRFQDLVEREVTLVGGNVNLSNVDTLATILGAELYGKQTGQFSLGLGSNPDLSKVYRFVLNGQDRKKRAMQWVLSKGQPESQGNIMGASESGYFMINFIMSVIGDSLYPDTADLIRVSRAD